jgi:hypothetical protein
MHFVISGEEIQRGNTKLTRGLSPQQQAFMKRYPGKNKEHEKFISIDIFIDFLLHRNPTTRLQVDEKHTSAGCVGLFFKNNYRAAT